MEQTRNGTGWKAGVTLAYVLMVGVNSLANIIPLNGITTGEVSDNYSNLFAPAGLTFFHLERHLSVIVRIRALSMGTVSQRCSGQ